MADLLGSLHTGDILITTRRDIGWRRLGLASVRLDVLNQADSVDLVRETLDLDLDTGAAPDSDKPNDGKDLEELPVELAGLPLALEQAAAYIAQQRIPLSVYLQRLRSDPAGLLGKVAHDRDSERAVAKVWSVTLQRLRDHNPDAVTVLSGLAWLAPDNIPRTLVQPPCGHDNTHDLLALLASYGMITLTYTTISVHRLLQLVIRTSDPDSSGAERAVAWRRQAWPSGDPQIQVATWPTWRELLPHVTAVTTHVGKREAGQMAQALAFLAGEAGGFASTQPGCTEAVAVVWAE